MREFIRRLMDVFYVRPCIVCGRFVRISDELNLCHECAEIIPRYGQTSKTEGRITVSVLPYEKHIRRAMSKFKFRNKKYYGYTFGEVLYTRIRDAEWYDDIDCITCVPMKGRKRLYNQSAVIAGHVAKSMNIPFAENALVKIKDNPPFYKLGRNERLKLIKGAFDIGDDLSFVGKRVLLIDDIYTTGVTVGECRRVLNMNGAAEVYCATVCYGVNTHFKRAGKLDK